AQPGAERRRAARGAVRQPLPLHGLREDLRGRAPGGGAMKVLFVCAGNLCRSPFAEGLARRLASERGLDIEFESAGEIAYEGSPCTPDALAAARLHGVDLSAHRPRRLTPERRA